MNRDQADSVFRAAEGWLELGNLDEAANELNSLPPKFKSSAQFVRLFAQIYSRAGAWSNVGLLCDTLLQRDPEDSFALLLQAEALHRQGKTRAAIEFLAPAFDVLPNYEETVRFHYAMARYHSAIGLKDAALTCIEKAIHLDKRLRGTALSDPELAAIWTMLQDETN